MKIQAFSNTRLIIEDLEVKSLRLISIIEKPKGEYDELQFTCLYDIDQERQYEKFMYWLKQDTEVKIRYNTETYKISTAGKVVEIITNFKLNEIVNYEITISYK